MQQTFLRVLQVNTLPFSKDQGGPAKLALTRRVSGTAPKAGESLSFAFDRGAVSVAGVAAHKNDLVSVLVRGDLHLVRQGTQLVAR